MNEYAMKTVEKLKVISEKYKDDEEVGHQLADNALCGLLRNLGYDDVVEEWLKVDKYYV